MKDDRVDVVNKTLDDLFGVAGTHECRVCSSRINDGRKNYCCEKCRKLAYAVKSLYRWSSLRERILERDNWTCQECGKDVSEGVAQAHVDHIVPISKNGAPLDPTNLRTLCQSCNASKGDKLPESDMEMENIPVRAFLCSRMDEVKLSGDGLWDTSEQPNLERNDRIFQCPECNHWVGLEEALETEQCGTCGTVIEIRAVKGRDPR